MILLHGSGNNGNNQNSTFFFKQDWSGSEGEEYVSSPDEEELSLEELIGDLVENDDVGDFQYRFRRVFDLIADEDSQQRINANCSVNTIEMWLVILKYSIANGLSCSAIADLCKLINTILNRKVINDTRYRIDQLFNPSQGVQLHAVCPDCKTYLGRFDKTMRSILCDICEINVDLKNPSFRDFFMVFDIRNDIRNLIQTHSLHYTSIMQRQYEGGNGQWRDIYDGQKYRAFRISLPDHKAESYATLNFNSDGAPVFESSKFSIWPIQVVVNEIPKQSRYKKPIVHSLWFGHDKPDMTYFLRPFVDEMNDLSDNGINCNINGIDQQIYVYALCCCVDSTARPPMQGIVQFNGYHSCSWCLHPGERIFHGRGSAIKFPLQREIPQRRTADETLQHVTQAMNSRLPIFGMKKPSPLLNLDQFHIIDGFVPDSMHHLDLGVAKKFLEYWLETSETPYCTPKRHLDEIDENMKSLKVPTQLMRLSRSIKDRKYWKAKEYQNWILYYSVPILDQIPGFEVFVRHWALLVEAYHILLQNNITVAVLQKADRILRAFVAGTEYHYGPHAMSYNVHQLLHLAQSVADWGPLWCHNGYTFESGNYRILRSVHAAKGVLSQVCRHLSYNVSAQILEGYVRTLDESPAIDFIDYLDNRITNKTLKMGENRYFVKSRIRRNVIDALQLPLAGLRLYDKMVRNTNMFRSCREVLYRSDNSYATLRNGTYVRIYQFIVNTIAEEDYVAYKKINVRLGSNINNELTSIKHVIGEENAIRIASVQELEKLCVFINLQGEQYITSLANMNWQ